MNQQEDECIVICSDIHYTCDYSYEILWCYDSFLHSLIIKVKKYDSVFANLTEDHNAFSRTGPEYLYALSLMYYYRCVNTINFRQLDDEIFYDDEVRNYHFNCFDLDDMKI